MEWCESSSYYLCLHFHSKNIALPNPHPLHCPTKKAYQRRVSSLSTGKKVDSRGGWSIAHWNCHSPNKGFTFPKPQLQANDLCTIDINASCNKDGSFCSVCRVKVTHDMCVTLPNQVHFRWNKMQKICKIAGTWWYTIH